MTDLTLSASAYIHSGLSVAPSAGDGRPAGSWKTYRERLMTEDEIPVNFTRTAGLGIIAGPISGNICAIEFAPREGLYEEWFEKLAEFVKNSLVVERLPSGGRRVYYRLLDPEYNQTPYGEVLRKDESGLPLIVYKGEGDFIECSPTEGYKFLKGDFRQIKGLSACVTNPMLISTRGEKAEDAKPAVDEDAKPTGGEGVTAPAQEQPLPHSIFHIPGFVDSLAAHTLATAPYPNLPLAFAGALAMLAHLSGRNFRDSRNLRTNVYLLALADSGVGKDYPRKVNMNLAAELGIMEGMADRFASAEGLEDALLIRPCSFFQVDEVDTLFAALGEKGDSAMERIYGSLLQFATSADTRYAMRKKAIAQPGGKSSRFEKIRAKGIHEPHLVMLGTAIPKYLYSALSERAMENGLISRCLVIEAGERGDEGEAVPRPLPGDVVETAKYLVGKGGFGGLDIENLDAPEETVFEPMTVVETEEATALRKEKSEQCNAMYKDAKTTSEKALWSRAAEKASRLALLYAISENPRSPIITLDAMKWAWRFVCMVTARMLYQASVYVHDNEFDRLQKKALRILREYGQGQMLHKHLLQRMHVDADTLHRVIDTLLQADLIFEKKVSRGGKMYFLKDFFRQESQG